jgi:hypothetical protein
MVYYIVGNWLDLIQMEGKIGKTAFERAWESLIRDICPNYKKLILPVFWKNSL